MLSQAGNICPHCRATLPELYAEYPRGIAPSSGANRYGKGYLVVASAWGLLPGICFLLMVSIFGAGAVHGPVLGVVFVAAIYLAQVAAAFGMMSRRRFVRAFTGLHALVMFGVMLYLVSLTYTQLFSHPLSLAETVAFGLVFAETLLSGLVLRQLYRAWQIDRSISQVELPGRRGAH
ncbi:MAG: hypothetical protein JSS65_08765 [Armatimonadetes bacterium]|nr:hypothetical protein [Armatimonadota bacterium]